MAAGVLVFRAVPAAQRVDATRIRSAGEACVDWPGSVWFRSRLCDPEGLSQDDGKDRGATRYIAWNSPVQLVTAIRRPATNLNRVVRSSYSVAQQAASRTARFLSGNWIRSHACLYQDAASTAGDFPSRCGWSGRCFVPGGEPVDDMFRSVDRSSCDLDAVYATGELDLSYDRTPRSVHVCERSSPFAARARGRSGMVVSGRSFSLPLANMDDGRAPRCSGTCGNDSR